MSKKIIDIKNEFSQSPIQDIKTLIKEYENDERVTVKRLITSYSNKLRTYEKEKIRLETICEYEKEYHSKGYVHIAGIDEVGRGPLAGPVVSCAVILPKDAYIEGINDSKKLSPKKREEIFIEIKKQAIDIGIGIVEPKQIDEINILNATKLSMKIALHNLKTKPDYLFIDALTLHDVNIPQLDIIKGDEKSISISAASIVAKVTRDAIMQDYHKIYPNYNFNSNKGYGSKDHIEGIKKHGLCPIHRRSFVKKFVFIESELDKMEKNENKVVKKKQLQ